MELVDRKTAKELQLTKYFTGKECSNGHVAERYVLSGACEACVRANVAAARGQHATIMADPTREARKAFSKAAVSHREPVVLAALPGVLAMVAALTVGRFPGLHGAPFLTAEPKVVDKTGPVGKAYFLVHPDDVPAVIALCRSTIDTLCSAPAPPPVLSPMERDKRARRAADVNNSPMEKEFIP